jgi:hypothetical protein
MKENIINKLKELLKYKTIQGEIKEFQKLFNYIKQTTKETLYIKEYTFNDYDFFQKYEYTEQGNKITMNWVTKYYDDNTTKSELKICDSN